MALSSGIAVYFICWWITLLAVLPFGVRTQEEEGNVVPGTVPSAPANFRIGRKMLMATVFAFIPFGFVYLISVYDIISFDDIPFLPEFSND